MSTRALRRDLATIAEKLGPDELRVLVEIATRAWLGQARYGCLDLRHDRRDFEREAAEELVDGLFYLTADLLRRQRPRARTPRVAAAAPAGRRGETTEAVSRSRRETRCHKSRGS